MDYFSQIYNNPDYIIHHLEARLYNLACKQTGLRATAAAQTTVTHRELRDTSTSESNTAAAAAEKDEGGGGGDGAGAAERGDAEAHAVALQPQPDSAQEPTRRSSSTTTPLPTGAGAVGSPFFDPARLQDAVAWAGAGALRPAGGEAGVQPEQPNQDRLH